MAGPDPVEDVSATPLLKGEVAWLWRLLPRPLGDILSAKRARVDGPSMVPTLRDGDLVLASRAALARAALARGDIVLMRDPESGVAYVKRVVGLPGEDIGVHSGRVAIHGSPLDEPYLAPLDSRAAARDGQWTLADDRYFLLGDNRNDSLDSRAFGPVAGGWIVGRVWYRYGPAGRVGALASSPKGR